MEYRFYLGIDADGEESTSVTLLEKRQERADAGVTYHVNRIERLAGADPVEHVKTVLAEEPYLGHSVCVVNASNREGRKLLRHMAAEGLAPMAISINGGDDPSPDGPSIQPADGDGEGSGFSVSERTIIRNLIDRETAGSFMFDSQQADLASALASGLQDYRTTENDESGSSTEASSEPSIRNRDLVISAALACWVGDQQAIDPTEHLGGELPTTGGAKRMQRPDSTS